MRVALSYLGALLVVVIVYGAIPFLCIPWPGEIVWTSGFAKSFINAGWPSIKAINFGIPALAPIPFGLPGAFLQSTLIYLFWPNAIDAYALGAVIWLAIALLGCTALARLLGASPVEAPFFSLMYLTLPIVWWHAPFSMLSVGFALLPLYLYFALRLIYHLRITTHLVHHALAAIVPFLFVSLLAIFIDGYTYVMFFVAAGCFFFIAAIRGDLSRFRLAFVTAPVLLFAIFFSYIVYTHYLGVRSFETAPIDSFRGWGVDVVMMLIPSQGISWLCDICHFSVPRSDQEFFGDASVWMTTFSAPLLLFGSWGFITARRQHLAVHLLCISVLGFYFALGPSLKVNSVRPRRSEATSATRSQMDWTMPKSAALVLTGSEIFSEHVPGFRSMRAAYRWSGLLFVGLFGLSVLLLKELRERGQKTLAYLIPSIVIILNLPDLPRQFTNTRANWKAMQQMGADLKPLNARIGGGARVVFYPQGNDFIVNYLSAQGGYFTYNVGGDKNVELASKFWPLSIRNFFLAPLTDGFDEDIERVLLSKDTDKVVIPYFDMLVNASEWPPDQKLISEKRAAYAVTLSRLFENPLFLVENEHMYAIVSLKGSGNTSRD